MSWGMFLFGPKKWLTGILTVWLVVLIFVFSAVIINPSLYPEKNTVGGIISLLGFFLLIVAWAVYVIKRIKRDMAEDDKKVVGNGGRGAKPIEKIEEKKEKKSRDFFEGMTNVMWGNGEKKK